MVENPSIENNTVVVLSLKSQLAVGIEQFIQHYEYQSCNYEASKTSQHVSKNKTPDNHVYFFVYF